MPVTGSRMLNCYVVFKLNYEYIDIYPACIYYKINAG